MLSEAQNELGLIWWTDKGNGPRFWINLQANYNIETVNDKIADDIQPVILNNWVGDYIRIR